MLTAAAVTGFIAWDTQPAWPARLHRHRLPRPESVSLFPSRTPTQGFSIWRHLGPDRPLRWGPVPSVVWC